MKGETMTEISEAAWRRMTELGRASKYCIDNGPAWVPDRHLPSTEAFARYIQQVSDTLKGPYDALRAAAFAPDGEMRKALAPFILPEPVDPLLIEARDIAANEWNAQRGFPESHGRASQIRAGHHDDARDVSSALAGLRRGMELAKEQQSDFMRRNAATSAVE